MSIINNRMHPLSTGQENRRELSQITRCLPKQRKIAVERRDVAEFGLQLETYIGSQDPTGSSRGEEALLIERLRQGEEYAYEELLNRFQQPVYNLVYRLMSDSSDSNDVVQEVFLKVFRNVGSFRAQSSLKTWIYRIAV